MLALTLLGIHAVGTDLLAVFSFGSEFELGAGLKQL